jgi:hypothetical protein
MLQTLASLLLALFKAIPALDTLFSRLQTELARQREATAAQRRAAKDAAVDSAVDAAVDSSAVDSSAVDSPIDADLPVLDGSGLPVDMEACRRITQSSDSGGAPSLNKTPENP